MRRQVSRLCWVGGFVSLFVAIAGGCAGGRANEASSEDPTYPSDDDDDDLGKKIPASSDDDDDDDSSSTPGGKKKPASKDASADAPSGSTTPEPGDPCKTVDEIFTRSCGACGTQQALCQKKGSSKVVSVYGDCSGEKVGGCTAGAIENVACGNCGTQKRTCTKFCEWVNAACTGQPANSCSPGAVELSSASCNANEFVQRTCQGSCTWGNFGTCAPPPSFITVPSAIGSTNSSMVILSGSKVVAHPGTGSCPAYYLDDITPYAYLEIRNTNTKPAMVTIYNSQATGGSIIDTILAVYAGATPPATDTQRKACMGEVEDYGSSSLTGDSDFAAITSGITIPANGSVTVMTASYWEYDPSDPTDTTGPVMLNVRTDSFGP